MLTDTHCHLDMEKFNTDRAAVIQRALDANLTRILIPGLDVESSRRIVKLTESHPMLYAGVGVHPNSAETWRDDSINQLRNLILRPHPQPFSLREKGVNKVVAIGEIGLDYYWNKSAREHQQKVLREQLNLAEELSLPVIIHIRETDDAEDGECAADTMILLEEFANRLARKNDPLGERPGVLHSFSGSGQTAQRALNLNFYLGMTGPITYKNAQAKREKLKAFPLEKILIETDAPYLTPEPQRGKRNEPAFVTHIADKIAEIHLITREEVGRITTQNAERLFAWGGSF